MTEHWVVVGRVSGLHGVRGWIKVFSYTEPRDNIVTYSPWRLSLGDDDRCFPVTGGGAHGKGVIAQLDGVTDRDLAAKLVGAEIRADRNQFGAAGAGEFFWADLVGLEVVTTDGRVLGHVDSMMATGANDVMIVVGERRRLLPFVMDDVVKEVDIAARRVRVAWNPDD